MIITETPSSGYTTIRFTHYDTNQIFGDGAYADKATLCELCVNGLPYIGEAFKSTKDNFCKEKGRQIALDRAIKWAVEKGALNPKDTRKIVGAYLAR